MKVFSLILLLDLLIQIAPAQCFDSIPNKAFRRGEKLEYRLYFRSFITGRVYAGEITLQIKGTNRKFNGRDTYDVELTGKSRKSFHWFIKVEDKFESFVDEKSLFPWLFIRQTREGHFTKDDEVIFRPDSNLAISRYAVKKIPPRVQDIISAYYFARTVNFIKLPPGEAFSVPIFYEDSVFTSNVMLTDKETIRTRMGSFNCVKIRPGVRVGKVFSDRFPMTVWISDDENQIPIFVKAALSIGSVEIELIESSGLANPLLSKLN
jgi:hypothetical protein